MLILNSQDVYRLIVLGLLTVAHLCALHINKLWVQTLKLEHGLATNSVMVH